MQRFFLQPDTFIYSTNSEIIKKHEKTVDLGISSVSIYLNLFEKSGDYKRYPRNTIFFSFFFHLDQFKIKWNTCFLTFHKYLGLIQARQNPYRLPDYAPHPHLFGGIVGGLQYASSRAATLFISLWIKSGI